MPDTSPATPPAGPRTLVEKIWDDHVVAQDDGSPAVLAIDLHLVHEVTAPGVHRASAPAAFASAGPSAPSPRPTIRRRPRRAACRSSTRWPPPRSSSSRRTAADFGDPDPRLRLRDPGDRPRHRPGAGPHPARHDDRLRRQPHGDARGVRGARLRDRDERGRDGPRHPDAPPASAEDVRGPGRRAPRSRASARRTSSSPSSPGSGSAAAPGTSSSTAARRSARSRWSSG